MGSLGYLLPVVPFLPTSTPKPLAQQRVLDGTLQEYGSWSNLKTDFALRTALSFSPGGHSEEGGRSGGNALGQAAATWLALTAGEKLVKGYNEILNRFADRHPGFQEYRNAHPILGNIVSWIPGVAAAGAGGLGIYALCQKAMQTGGLKRLLNNPLLGRIAPFILIGGALLTSLPGLLLKNEVKSVAQSGRDYRAARKENPDLTPAQLAQLVKATRNQQYLAQLNQAQALQREADLNPFYVPGAPLSDAKHPAGFPDKF